MFLCHSHPSKSKTCIEFVYPWTKSSLERLQKNMVEKPIWSNITHERNCWINYLKSPNVWLYGHMVYTTGTISYLQIPKSPFLLTQNLLINPFIQSYLHFMRQIVFKNLQATNDQKCPLGHCPVRHAQSSKEQSVLLAPEGQLCFTKFISPNTPTLQSTACTNHFPVLIPFWHSSRNG